MEFGLTADMVDRKIAEALQKYQKEAAAPVPV